MDETEVFTLNFLQSFCKIALRILWIKGVLEVIRYVVSQLGVGTGRASGVRFDEVGKGFARDGRAPTCIEVKREGLQSHSGRGREKLT